MILVNILYTNFMSHMGEVRMWVCSCKILIILVVYSEYVSSIPTDLTCKGVVERNTIDLHHCKFKDGNSTDISCVIFAEAYDPSDIQPVKIAVQFTTVFTLKTLINATFPPDPGSSPWWCLGIRSSRLVKIDSLPNNATSIGTVMNFPKAVAQLLALLVSGEAYVEFHGDAAAGFAKLYDQCDPEKGNLSDWCILIVKGSSYVVSPGDEDISIWDVLFKRVMGLYFTTMRGTLVYLQMSTTLTGYFASWWLKQLSITHVQSVNASNNNFFGDDQTAGTLPHVLEDLDNLTHLEMRSCRLRGIHPDNFAATPNLVSLDLCGNQLSSPPGQLGRQLRALTFLNLCSQQPVDRFTLGDELRDLPQLRVLKLQGTPLVEIDRSHFPPSLEYLDLSRCQLVTLPEDVFSDLTTLHTLILNSNNLQTLHPSIFSTLQPNSLLNLAENKFRIGQNFSITSLSHLDLSNNRIKLPQNIISKGKIYNLDLSGNEIINWTSTVYFQTENYSILNMNISYNTIPVVDNLMIPSLNSLNSVDLGGNQFDCQDCSLREFQNFLNSTPTKILLLNSTTPVRCILPPKQKGQLLLEAQYNYTSCEETPTNFFLVAGIPISVLLFSTFLAMLIVYAYRYEIAYMRHLYSVKKKSEGVTERSKCRYDVFVSYSSRDRDWVLDVLLPGLENPREKYTLCLHERDFELGRFIMENVVQCIDRSRRTLLVLTKNYIESEWCKWELQMAQHRIFEECEDFLILLEQERLDRASLPAHLRLLMDTRTYLEWPDPAGDLDTLRSFWTRLIDTLGTPLAVSHPDRISGDFTSSEEEENDEDDENRDDDDDPLIQ